MTTKIDKFEVGLWYIVTYADGTQKRFQFVGSEPPRVDDEGEGFKTLAEILRDCVKVEQLC